MDPIVESDGSSSPESSRHSNGGGRRFFAPFRARSRLDTENAVLVRVSPENGYIVNVEDEYYKFKRKSKHQLASDVVDDDASAARKGDGESDFQDEAVGFSRTLSEESERTPIMQGGEQEDDGDGSDVSSLSHNSRRRYASVAIDRDEKDDSDRVFPMYITIPRRDSTPETWDEEKGLKTSKVEENCCPPSPPLSGSRPPLIPWGVRTNWPSSSSAIPRPSMGRNHSAPSKYTAATADASTFHPGLSTATTASVSHTILSTSHTSASGDWTGDSLMENRPRRRPSGLAATISIGSIVGQSTIVTVPAFRTSMSSDNPKSSDPHSTLEERLEQLELGAKHSKRFNAAFWNRQRSLLKQDIKRVFGRASAPIRQLVKPEEKPDLKRAAGCLT